MFTNIHNHTHFSLLDGMIKIPPLISRVKELGMKSVGITDHGNIGGIIPFFEECVKNKIKPIIGCEFYFTRDLKSDKPNHLVLLAKDGVGYKNLIKLVSFGHTEGFYYKPRITWDYLRNNAEGLVCLTGCIKGEIPRAYLDGNDVNAEVILCEYLDLFGKDNVFIEVTNHGIKEELEALPKLIKLGEDNGVSVVATNDTHYVWQTDSLAHEALLCIQTNGRLADEKHYKFSSDQFWFKSASEMSLPEKFLENTELVVEKCNLALDLTGSYLPNFPIPANETPDSYLRKLVYEGAVKRYGEINKERVEYELGVIEKTGFAGYFLIVQDIVKEATAKKITMSAGRGSSAGSIVSYCLGITNVDPLEFGLLFERFLTADRISPPDIDMDFEDARRGEVFEYIKNKYGKESVSQIITFGVMASRAVIRDVARVMGVDLGLSDKLAKSVPQGETLHHSLQISKDFREFYDTNAECKKVVEMGFKLEGVIRNAGVHPAGVVISPGQTVEYAPLQKVKENIVIGWDMKSVEKAGLLKIDILGLKTLTVINECRRLILERTGEDILSKLNDYTDEETYKLISSGENAGVFQLESSGISELCRKTQPKDIFGVMAINALFRPGPLGSGMVEDYIKRKNGEDAVYIHPLLESVLKETHGVFVYQEQIMEMSRVLAGFSLAEGDKLRKAMGKKDIKILNEMKPRFLEGAKSKGVSESVANKILELITPFAGYAFNKPHAAAYAVLSYQTAYLKVHYPLEFWAACLTSEISDTDKLCEYINTCKRNDITILPPDVNKSDWNFVIEDDGIRYALGALKEVGVESAKQIVAKRDRRYTGLVDLCSRVTLRTVNKGVLESLICSGAFDSFGHSRAQYVATLEDTVKWAGKVNKKSHFEALFDMPDLKDEFPVEYERWNERMTLDKEKDFVGFYLTKNPNEADLNLISLYIRNFSNKLVGFAKGTDVVVGGIIQKVKKILDKKGKEMCSMILKDPLGEVEVIIFSRAYAENQGKIRTGEAVLVWGEILDNQEVKVSASYLNDFDNITKYGYDKFCVKILDYDEEKMQSLKALTETEGLALYVNLEGKVFKSEKCRIKATKDNAIKLNRLFGFGNVSIK